MIDFLLSIEMLYLAKIMHSSVYKFMPCHECHYIKVSMLLPNDTRASDHTVTAKLDKF